MFSDDDDDDDGSGGGLLNSIKLACPAKCTRRLFMAVVVVLLGTRFLFLLVEVIQHGAAAGRDGGGMLVDVVWHEEVESLHSIGMMHRRRSQSLRRSLLPE